MEYIDSVKVRALASVMEPNHDDALRDIFEWYSRTFHTPLHEVDTLPLDEVLIAYYRFIYREMEPEERHNLAIWLLETPEERAERKRSETQLDEKAIEEAKAHNARVQGKSKRSKAEQIFEQMKARVKDRFDSEDGIGKKLNLPDEKPLSARIPEGTLTGDIAPGEEVTVNYVSPADFERELEASEGPQPKRRK
jgi:hypothetical protein